MEKFLQKRDILSVFQAPDNGETVEFNPPGLVWIAEKDVEKYRVHVTDEAGNVIADRETDCNIFRFESLLKPGTYRWNVFANGAELGEQSFTVPEDARPFVPPTAKELLDKASGEHPRHRFTREEIPTYRERFAEELKVLRRNVAAALRQPLMEYPDIYTKYRKMDLRTALDRIREFLDRDTVACALIYLFDGDKAAGERARDAVLRVMSWSPFGECSIRNRLAGMDEIGLSICRTIPSIFDWTWDLYTEQERRWIGETLAIHARDNYERMTVDNNYLADPGKSHLGRQPGYLGEAALVLHEFLGRETAEKYLQYALDVYSSLFPHYGGRGGGWAEGVFYGSSYTKWYLPFFFAVEHLSGFTFLAKPFYRHLAEFFVHFAPPGQEAHPFGDGNWDTSVEWPGFQAQDPFGVYADRFGPETARNYSRQLRSGVETYHLHLLDLMYPIGKTQENREPASKSFICRDTGYISMRKDPENPVRDIAVQTRCSRFGASSHQHSDQGSVVVMAGGKALIVGTGTFGYLFGEEHHAKWTRQTVAHNCLMIDGEGQPRNEADAFGVIQSFDGNTAVIDLSKVYPMLTSYCRTITFDREKGVVTLIDELTAPKKVTVDFRLHSNYIPQQLANGNVAVESDGYRAEITASGEYSMTDVYEYNGYISRPGERHHFKQYHMNWRTENVQKLRLETVIQVTLP